MNYRKERGRTISAQLRGVGSGSDRFMSALVDEDALGHGGDGRKHELLTIILCAAIALDTDQKIRFLHKARRLNSCLAKLAKWQGELTRQSDTMFRRCGSPSERGDECCKADTRRMDAWKQVAAINYKE